jgi:hypothetical protein
MCLLLRVWPKQDPMTAGADGVCLWAYKGMDDEPSTVVFCSDTQMC